MRTTCKFRLAVGQGGVHISWSRQWTQLRNQGGPREFGGPHCLATAPRLRDLPAVRSHIAHRHV